MQFSNAHTLRRVYRVVLCLFVDEETKGSYLNELNGLNGVNGLAHLCIQVCAFIKVKLTGKIDNLHHLLYLFYCTVKYLTYLTERS
jgi:hypothetical protein